MWPQGGEGEGGLDWETNTDIYTRPCVNSGNLLCGTGSSIWCSVMT